MSVLHQDDDRLVYVKQNDYSQNTFFNPTKLIREVTHVFVKMGDRRFLYFDREKRKDNPDIICTLNSILIPKKRKNFTVEDMLTMRYLHVEEELSSEIKSSNFVRYTHLTTSIVVYERHFEHPIHEGILTFEQLEAYSGFEHKGFMPYVEIEGKKEVIESFYQRNKFICEKSHSKLKYCY